MFNLTRVFKVLGKQSFPVSSVCENQVEEIFKPQKNFLREQCKVQDPSSNTISRGKPARPDYIGHYSYDYKIVLKMAFLPY